MNNLPDNLFDNTTFNLFVVICACVYIYYYSYRNENNTSSTNSASNSLMYYLKLVGMVVLLYILKLSGTIDFMINPQTQNQNPMQTLNPSKNLESSVLSEPFSVTSSSNTMSTTSP